MRRVFEPVKIGNLELKNRLVRSATWEGIAQPDGSMTEQAYTIYEELAKGNDFIYAQTNDAFGQIETVNVKTGHTYQGKHQEVADKILLQLQEWRNIH